MVNTLWLKNKCCYACVLGALSLRHSFRRSLILMLCVYQYFFSSVRRFSPTCCMFVTFTSTFHIKFGTLFFIVALCILIVLSPLFVQLMHKNYYKIVKQLKSFKIITIIIVAPTCFGFYKPSSGSSRPVLR